jgi:hypothetical protein
MLKVFAATIIGLAVFTTSPAEAQRRAPKLTPMEVQALQSKEFETTKEVLFASVVSVFQDLGYQLDNADMGSGFITASSATVNKTSFLDALAQQSGSGNTKATAFVEQIGSMSRVRLNFLNTKTASGRYGTSRQDQPVLDPKTYQVAWEKLDEAIFVRSATAAPAKANPAENAPKIEVPVTPALTVSTGNTTAAAPKP